MTRIGICRLCNNMFYRGTNPNCVTDISYDEDVCPRCNATAYLNTFTMPKFEHPRAPFDRHIS